MCLTSGPAPAKLYAVYERSRTYNEIKKAIKTLNLPTHEKALLKLIWDANPNLTGWKKIATFSTEERRTLWLLASDNTELKWLTSIEAKQQLKPNNNGKIVAEHYMLEDDHSVDYWLYCH
jgi:hypothetical protein